MQLSHDTVLHSEYRGGAEKQTLQTGSEGWSAGSEDTRPKLGFLRSHSSHRAKLTSKKKPKEKGPWTDRCQEHIT